MLAPMASPSSPPSPSPPANGRQRLIDAALRLAASTRSLPALGLREVARQAGLNPNTFYRHFRDFDDLGLAVIEQLAGTLRRDLRERRRLAASGETTLVRPEDPAGALREAHRIVDESVGLVLDFVSLHRDAYVVAIRELHGASPVLRAALRRMLDHLADDMAEDVARLLPVPGLDPSTAREVSRLTIRQMTFFAMDDLERPERRAETRREATRSILLLFWGALAARAPGFLAQAGVAFPNDDAARPRSDNGPGDPSG